jgi:S-adenosylmethionine:tRNA ribosyltransferase-isomerase
MRTADFDFDLPEDRIALHPAVPRDAALLLVVRPEDDPQLEDHVVGDLPGLLRRDDVLVFNDTRVIPAALEGTRIRGPHETPVSFNLTKRVDESRWRSFAQPARRLEVGDLVRFGAETDGRVCLLGTLDATVVAKHENGEIELAFSFHSAFLDEAIDALGRMPLTP